VLAALDPEVALREQRPVPDLEPGALHLQRHASAPLSGSELEAQGAFVPRVGGDDVHPLDRLDARLHLAGLRGLRAEALDEPLHALDLGLLLVDRPSELQLARRRLSPPGMPRAREEAGAARFELQHGGAHRLEEPAIVSHEHHGGV
jgi:hypothetical protein